MTIQPTPGIEMLSTGPDRHVSGGIRSRLLQRTHRIEADPNLRFFIMRTLTPVGRVTIWSIVALSAIMVAAFIIQVW